MAHQVTPRRDSCKQAATANRLNAVRSIAPHIINATLHDERISKPVIRCVAQQPMLVGKVYIQPGQAFYMVRSRLDPYRFFVMVRNVRSRAWRCSLPEMTCRFTKLVEDYISELKSRKLQEVA